MNDETGFQNSQISINCEYMEQLINIEMKTISGVVNEHVSYM